MDAGAAPTSHATVVVRTSWAVVAAFGNATAVAVAVQEAAEFPGVAGDPEVAAVVAELPMRRGPPAGAQAN